MSSYHVILTSLSQSVRYVTYSKMRVCIRVPPIIPVHIPYHQIQIKLSLLYIDNKAYAIHKMFLENKPSLENWKWSRVYSQQEYQQYSNNQHSHMQRMFAIHILLPLLHTNTRPRIILSGLVKLNRFSSGFNDKFIVCIYRTRLAGFRWEWWWRREKGRDQRRL